MHRHGRAHLRFVRRGHNSGFSMREVAERLNLWRNKRRASANVKQVALALAFEWNEADGDHR